MSSLLRRVRAELGAAAIPERASQMQAYMKSLMPYHGVPATEMRAVCKKVFREIELPDAQTWQCLVLELWRGAKYREERYVAVELTGDRRAKVFQTLDALPMYEELIVSGAWWDFVDVLASHRLGELLRREPAKMKRIMLQWSRDDDLWKRRSSILCQLKFKEKTDLDLLYRCIEPSLGSKEFFLQKAIGWALRQHAWTDAKEVQRYVRENEPRLAALSKREALKNAGKR